MNRYKIIKYTLCFIIVLLCCVNMLYIDNKSNATIQNNDTKNISGDNNNIERTPIKEYVEIPTSFSIEQKQQVEKVHKVLKTEYGNDVFRHAEKASNKYGIDVTLIMAIILTESGFDQYAKNGNSYGLMQLSKNTSASRDCTNLYDIECNISASTKHLAGLHAKYNGNGRLALAAYNAGGGAVDVSIKGVGDIPHYTKNYVRRVNDYRQVIEAILN